MWLESPQQLQDEPPSVRAGSSQLSWEQIAAVQREGRQALLRPGGRQHLFPETSESPSLPVPARVHLQQHSMAKQKNNGLKCVYPMWTRPIMAILVSFTLSVHSGSFCGAFTLLQTWLRTSCFENNAGSGRHSPCPRRLAASSVGASPAGPLGASCLGFPRQRTELVQPILLVSQLSGLITPLAERVCPSGLSVGLTYREGC